MNAKPLTAPLARFERPTKRASAAGICATKRIALNDADSNPVIGTADGVESNMEVQTAPARWPNNGLNATGYSALGHGVPF
jgi:hypothetical protein